MTVKRFTYMEQFNGFCDVYDDGKILSCMRLEYVDKTVDLLNALDKENEQLKEQNENYRCALEQCGVNVKILDGDVE